jgi:uncharacterized membrane protein YgcG
MQQRQLRLGDVLDDYCPRERRVTNHAIVAMIGPDVKQTRCTTCDTEHEYKHAKVPRQRKKGDTPAALYAQVLANGPKRVAHEPPPESPVAPDNDDDVEADVMAAPDDESPDVEPLAAQAVPADDSDSAAIGDALEHEDDGDAAREDVEEGPVHRPLIRATLPRQEGAPPPQRPAPDFTIRQPAGRQNRFRQRPGGRGPQQFQGNRSGSGGNGSMGGGPHRGGGGAHRHGGGRPPGVMTSSRPPRRDGQGRKRSK